MSIVPLGKNTERRDLKEALVTAIEDLDVIIANTNNSGPVRKLARNQKKMIRRLAQL